MKREDKNQQTKRRIMDSALAEFSAQGYGASSINTICAAEDISKGIVYHYFGSKDGLFLACVEECFQSLTAYIRDNMQSQEDMENGLEAYFAIRTRFFHAIPAFQRIFCEAVISPPAHLHDEIQKRKQDFDDLNIHILEKLLEPFTLRPGISKDQVIDTFRLFQDFMNAQYQVANAEKQSFEAHEEKSRRVLSILLYGVIEKEKTENV